MSDNKWNYDAGECPLNTPVEFVFDEKVFVGSLTCSSIFKYFYGFGQNFDCRRVEHDRVAAWKLIKLSDLPKNNDVWILHGNNSFPNCHPLDLVKVRINGKDYPEKDMRRAKDWVWVCIDDSSIAEYCVVKKYNKGEYNGISK